MGGIRLLKRRCLVAHLPYNPPMPLPENEQPVLRIVPMPADTNAHGTIFGGWVMAQVDIAGSIPAWNRAAGPVVTIAVNSFVFKEPVFVGDLVSFYARVLKVGRTSVSEAPGSAAVA